MEQQLLYKIADVINAKSNRYRAVVPPSRHEYMTQVGDRLVRTYCLVLHVQLVGRTRYHKCRSVWHVFEKDIARVVGKIARRDPAFAERIGKGELTPLDVEIIVRRATYQSLRLRLATTALDLYLDNK